MIVGLPVEISSLWSKPGPPTACSQYTTIDLPVEIWQEVASYLPLDHLQKLYSVNRAFFKIALEAKYKVIRFEKLQSSLRYIHFLRDPVTSQYVRSLHLSSCRITEISMVKPSKGVLGKIFNRSPDHRTPYRINKKFVKQMVQVMHGLSAVTSMELCCWYNPSPDFLSILHTGWVTFGAALRHLKLEIPLMSFRLAMPPSAVFPCLEVLHLTFSVAYGRRDEVDPTTLMCELFAPFINGHHPTLRSLHLHAHEDQKFDPLPFLLRLCHLPRLTTFGLQFDFVNIQQADSKGLQHVLDLHARQLRELSLQIRSSRYMPRRLSDDEWYGQKILHVPFTKLAVLALRTELFPTVSRTAEYLHQFEDSLTSLDLSGTTISSHDDVEALTNAFTSRGILRKIKMPVYCLSPPLLSIFAAKLPGLEELCLTFEHISAVYPRSNFTWPPEGFGVALKRYDYSQWKLRYFVGTGVGECGSRSLTVCEQDLQAAFPGVYIRLDAGTRFQHTF
ncbi:hypothetical protein FPV67DRAFT_1164564 [Lyophyllum atratum]|nr:hypothetical protein FPV67DRAFT_1164564 [Lyophyllum atratum]